MQTSKPLSGRLKFVHLKLELSNKSHIKEKTFQMETGGKIRKEI